MMKDSPAAAEKTGAYADRREGKRFLSLDPRTILLLGVLILAACAAGLSKYLFEDRLFVFYDIGSDTWEQYISFYAAISQKIARGDFSLWCSTIGLGMSIFMLNPTNPALMIVYLLGAALGPEIIPEAMIFLYIAEILLSGMLAYLYLSSFSFGEFPKLIASFMYAFSGYMIVWGQHYQFAIVPALLMLELLMAERCLRTRRWAGLAVSTAITVLSSMYIAYMILLFTGVYLLLRLILREKSLKPYMREAFRVLWPVALGVGLSMVTLLPSAFVIFRVSDRIGESSSLFSRLFFALPSKYYETLLLRFFSCAAEGINDKGVYLNYYEGPCLFFTTLFPLLFWQYLCLLRKRKLSKRRKTLAIVLCALGLLAIFTPAAGTVFNGFTKTFNRWMFLMMPGFALISAIALEEIFLKKRFSHLGAFFGSITLVLGHGWLLFGSMDTRIQLVIFVDAGIGVAMLILLAMAMHGRTALEGTGLKQAHQILGWSVRFLPIFLTLTLFVNVCAELTANFRTRGSIEKNGELLERLEDPEVLGALQMLEAQDPGFYRVEKLYGATDSMDALFQNYRSLSCYCSTMNANVLVFAAKNWPGLFLWDVNHMTYRTDAEEPYLSRLLGLKYLVVREDLIDHFTTEKLEGTGKIPEGFVKIDTYGDVSIWRDPEVEGIMSFYDLPEAESYSVAFEERDTLAEIESAACEREDLVEAHVRAPQDGLLFAAIPYEEGWRVFVDGTEQKLCQVQTGFSGVRLTAGEHEVQFKYSCPGLSIGAAVSLASLLLFLILLLVFRIRKRG